jgi:hypothetical protein
MMYHFDEKMNDKHQGIVVVVAMIVAASLLSLGAVAVPTITPAFADGKDGDKQHDGKEGDKQHDGDDGVTQKAEAVSKCKQNFGNKDANANTNAQTMGACVAAAININELIVVGGSSPFAGSTSEASPGGFSAPSTP